MFLKFLGLFLLGSLQLYSQETISTIVVDDKEEVSAPLNPYSTYKVENVSGEKFRDSNRQTLADLVKDQVGVDAQTYCSNCGAKRLTINGLKGEHTSILVDGLPLHSAVSSFYGVDSVPVNGIERIEVMRGTGASMTNPEAIGGTLNLITVDPLTKKQSYSTSLNVDDTLNGTAQNHSALFSLPSNDKTHGFTFGAQYTKQETWDEDENGVAESPQRDNYSLFLKERILLNRKNDIQLRLSHSNLTILGGPTNPTRPNAVRATPAQESDFQDGNVEKRYLGDPEQITDWVSLKRYEAAVHWIKYLSQTLTMEWNSGFARQEQEAIYQHGFDYAHNDNLFVSDFSLNWLANSSHIFKIGFFHKTQRLRSASEELFVNRSIPKDNFDNTSYAGYLKYSYLHAANLEMDFALRIDSVRINWTDLTNEVEKLIVAPRYQLYHKVSHHLTQRFSYGYGYRAPLTFFESQHGNNENGYQVDITDLEKAHSLVYSLSYNTPKYYITGGVHYTHLIDMAYGFESEGNPIFYRNTDEGYDIWASDLLLGYKVTPGWMLEGSLEFFNYQGKYTSKLPTAAIESRLQIKSSYAHGPWTHNLTATIVGSRDLSRYGRYTEHDVDRNQFPIETRGDEQKDQTAPIYYMLDTSLTYKFKKKYSAIFGISNLLNDTQTGRGDNPSAWHWHFNHAHYDGLHTWGPNRGREFYIRFAADF